MNNLFAKIIDTASRIYLGKRQVGNLYFSKVPNCKVIVGKYSLSAGKISENSISSDELIRVGNYCSMGRNLTLIMGNGHIPDSTTNYSIRQSLFGDTSHVIKKKIEMGNDVWIGDNVTIIGDAKIGNGVVIGACSLVTANQVLEDFGIYVGVPAKLMRYRFSKEVREEITKSQWWNWDKETALKNIAMLEKRYDNQGRDTYTAQRRAYTTQNSKGTSKVRRLHQQANRAKH